MIFIGEGALLWRAVRAATAGGYRVDLVCTRSDQTAPDQVPVLKTRDVNTDAIRIKSACSDGLVWSINNPTILRAPLLDFGLRIYNIHNGPLPAYRGRPEIAITYALLNGETRYGATLHEVDHGVDTGAVLDVEEFPIRPEDRFQEVMMTGLRACHTLFERNLDAAVNGLLTPAKPSTVGGGYYGRERLEELAGYRGSSRYDRAGHLGVFTPVYPDLAAALADPATAESAHS
ncbi:formyltransferase family protein [Rhodococcus xishaensis]|uniref:formyltransferase family protein n=1 Tax=Rhodococcus xishaensis TaxID=2487364 RepID=UPI0013E3E74F|nr:formyltransferase family protein [Rhodococcus xishaensis]